MADETYEVDARGLACPEPVMRARSALLKKTKVSVAVLVDTGTSRDNLVRLGEREHRPAIVEARAGGGWRVVFGTA